MLKNSDFTSIIALSIPFSVHEQSIKDIFQCGFSPKKIDFIFSSQILPLNKNVIVTFESNDQAKQALQFYSCSFIDHTKIHFYAADKETKNFLKEKRKTIYFYTTDNILNYPHFYAKCQEFGEIENFQFDEKNKNGSVTFQYTESAIKARYELEREKTFEFHIKTSLSSLLADHSRKEKDFSFFLQQTKNSQLTQKLKEGDDSSIFMLDINVNIDEQFLHEFLNGYEITRIKLRKRKDHEISNPSLFAIITFESREKAKEVLNEYNFTKFDNKTIRIDLADTETRKILATNQGKILVSNLKTDIEISQMFESFSTFGEIVDIEMPTKNDENCGFCYIQYRNKEDAEKVIDNLTGAAINDQLINIKMVDENDKNVPYKEFLFKKSYSININNQNIRPKDILCYDLSLMNEKSELFYFLIENNRKIESTKLVSSFLSPKIAQNLQNDKKSLTFSIKAEELNSISANQIKLIEYLSTLIQKNPKKENLINQFIKITKQIILSIKEYKFKEYLTEKVKKCYDYLYETSNNIQKNDDLLNFILLIEIFTQFENKLVVDFCINLFINHIRSTQTIKNIQACLTSLKIKHILESENQENNFISDDQEIDFISKHFIEIDPMKLNKISAKTLKKAIKKSEVFTKDEDKFLYQILHFDDEYKQYFINYVDFTKVTNKAMNFFLKSIDFSFINEEILGTISTRLSLPFYEEKYQQQEEENSEQPQYLQIMMNGIQNLINISVNSEENDLFKIFVNEDIYIEINKNSAITISPNIRKNLETDITFSSFHIKLDSQTEFLDKYVKALTYFMPQEIILNYKEFENKFYDQIKYLFNLFEKEGISNFIDYIFKFPSNEQNSFNYAVLVSIFINLGNFKIVEYLVNSIINSKEIEIENYEDLRKRLEYKKILKYNDIIKIDESKERTFIVNNFANIFSNITSFNDIDEMLWRIISIRLSFKVFLNSYDYTLPLSNKNSDETPNINDNY